MNVNVNDKNLSDDILEANEIEILMDNEIINLEKTVTKTKENEYKIEIIGVPEEKTIEIKIKEGAFTDILGWRSDEYIQTI